MDAVNAGNILSWLLQVTLIASAGALLGATLRIPHARTRLVYCYAVMLAAVFLPAFQPVQHALTITTGSAPQAPAIPGTPSQVSWTTIILLTLAAGFLVRLAWVAAGFVQLSRLRRRSSALETIPACLYEARRVVGVDVAFRVSDSIRSPAALGHVDPVVLFPRCFAALSERAQYTIAVHELLHVKRSDWLRTVVEQCLTVVFWFNPGMWWLVAESRLCREEIVDAHVVALTAERAPYVGALLAFATVKTPFKPLPAAPFFSKRQFSHRLHALVKPRRHSIARLALSYSAMILVVFRCAIFSFVLFPVQGRTEVLNIRASLLSPPMMFFRPIASAQVAAGGIAVSPALTSREAVVTAQAADPGQDVVFVVRRLHIDEHVLPAPPLSLPPAVAAIRAISPGEVVAPAEIARLLATIPPGQRIEITQDSNNRVTRIVMGRAAIRRASNEIHRFAFDVPVDAVYDDTATVPAPTDPADSVD